MTTTTEHFETFMRNYQGMVFSTAMRLLANQSEAEDVSQEVFLKAFERFAEISQSPTAGGWLKTVATNLCLNHLTRYRARWKFFSEFVSKDDEDQEITPEFGSTDNVREESELADQRRVLEEALQKLPPAQRVPLVLYHFEDRS